MAESSGLRMGCSENRCLKRLDRSARYRVEPIEEESRDVLLAWGDKYVFYAFINF